MHGTSITGRHFFYTHRRSTSASSRFSSRLYARGFIDNGDRWFFGNAPLSATLASSECNHRLQKRQFVKRTHTTLLSRPRNHCLNQRHEMKLSNASALSQAQPVAESIPGVHGWYKKQPPSGTRDRLHHAAAKIHTHPHHRVSLGSPGNANREQLSSPR
jgi:hypothetical protein